MSQPYANLLSPLKIRNTVLKNRMAATSSMLHFTQGPEKYPGEGLMAHFAKKAKSGAALITARGVAARNGQRTVSNGGDIPHMPNFDLYDPKCQNYISQLADVMHFYNSKCMMNLGCRIFDGYDVVGGELIAGGGLQTFNQRITKKQYTPEMMQEIIDDYVEQAVILKDLGWDAVTLHMAYRHQAPGRFLSPLTNTRTDEYGGDITGRAKFPLEIVSAIRKAVGNNMLIEILMSADEPVEGGTTIEDSIKFAKMAEEYVDIFQLRYGIADPAHPTGFNPKAEPFIHYAEAFKDAGVKAAILTSGGYQNPEVMDRVIAEGKADLIGMARSWISNVDYGTKLYENRADDIVPCVRCNKCHVVNMKGPWVSVCSVNPQVGLEHRVSDLVVPAGEPKKVAIIGGGPAGMEAAIIAAERGDDVTLYERSSYLGGQLMHADYCSFKWPMRNFKDYLIYQCGKKGVKVLLNTEATPDMIRAGGYDVVLAATGAEPIILRIPGVDTANVRPAIDVFGREDELGENVVIIGGGEIGVETGIHLCQKGKKVTVIEMLGELAPEATPLHYRSMFQEAWEAEENFHSILNARCTRVSPDSVTYVDKEGAEHTVPADSIVIAAGTRARVDDAMKFYNTADRFAMIGDCNGVGNVQKVMRSAFSTASSIC